jgi:hypothetical protein
MRFPSSKFFLFVPSTYPTNKYDPSQLASRAFFLHGFFMTFTISFPTINLGNISLPFYIT